MATYVDGFIVPVPTANLSAYRKLARQAGRIFKEHGALSVIECWGDDVKSGKFTSFPQSVKLKADETVVFSWITYTSRKHRDSGHSIGETKGSLGAAVTTDLEAADGDAEHDRGAERNDDIAQPTQALAFPGEQG